MSTCKQIFTGHFVNSLGTHTFFNLVSDCLQDARTVALTQFLGSPQVIAGHLHLLLLKCHHGVLQRSAKTAIVLHYNSNVKVYCSADTRLSWLTNKHLGPRRKGCYAIVLQRGKGLFLHNNERRNTGIC